MPMKPLHQPFNWLASSATANSDASFAALVIDVTRGAKVIMDLLRRDAMEISNGTQPIFSTDDSDAITGLMAAGMEMLFEAADKRVNEFNEVAAKGEKA